LRRVIARFDSQGFLFIFMKAEKKKSFLLSKTLVFAENFSKKIYKKSVFRKIYANSLTPKITPQSRHLLTNKNRFKK